MAGWEGPACRVRVPGSATKQLCAGSWGEDMLAHLPLSSQAGMGAQFYGHPPSHASQVSLWDWRAATQHLLHVQYPLAMAAAARFYGRALQQQQQGQQPGYDGVRPAAAAA